MIKDVYCLALLDFYADKTLLEACIIAHIVSKNLCTNLGWGLLTHSLKVKAIFLVSESAVALSLYVGLARTAPPTNTNFRLTFLLTQLQEALYEDLPV